MHLHAKALNQQPYLRRSHLHNSSVSSKNNNNTPIISRTSRSSSVTGGIQNKFQSSTEASNIIDANNSNQEQTLKEENKSNTELSKPQHSSFSSSKSTLSTSASLTQQDIPSRNMQLQHKISSRVSTSLLQELPVKPLQSNHHDMKEFFRAIKFNVLTSKKPKGEVMPQLQPQSYLNRVPYSLGNIPTMHQHSNSFQNLQFVNNDTQTFQKTSNEGSLYPGLSQRLNQKQQINLISPKSYLNQDKTRTTINTGFYLPQASSFSRSQAHANEDKSEQLSQRLEIHDTQHKQTKQQKINDRIRKVMNFSLEKELNDFVHQLSKPDKSISKSSILKFPSLTPKISPRSSLYASAQEEYFGNARVSAKFKTKLDNSDSLQNPFLEENLFNSLSNSSSTSASKKKQVHFILEDSLFDSNKKAITKKFI